jgi:hypothetical protein
VAVPVVRGGRPLGVLDVTSRREARFGALEADFLQQVAAGLVERPPPMRRLGTRNRRAKGEVGR